VSLIHDKTLRLPLAIATEKAPLTLMSTDVERIGQGVQFIHELWASLVEMGIGIYLLVRSTGLGSIPAAALILREIEPAAAFLPWAIMALTSIRLSVSCGDLSIRCTDR
jgi:hypothetical protein